MGLKAVKVDDYWRKDDVHYRVMSEPINGVVNLESVCHTSNINVPVTEVRRQFELVYGSQQANLLATLRGSGKSLRINLGTKSPASKKHGRGSEQSRWRTKQRGRV